MSMKECCCLKGDGGSKLSSCEGCRRASCDEDDESVSSLCEVPTRGAQCQKKKDQCCQMNLSTPDQPSKDRDSCKQETCPETCCAAKDTRCSLPDCNCDECDKICCRAEEWRCTSSCVSQDNNNVCASSCCRDKVCEKACGSPTEQRCLGNGVRAPDCGEVNDALEKEYKKICEANERIESYIKKTPCEPSEIFTDCLGLKLHFKKEFLQRTGSFKDRGAFNALLQLSKDQRERGVIAASAGNHALALAYAGSKLNIPVIVVLPTNAALVKIQKCRELKACVELYGQDFGEAERYAMQLGKERGLLYMNGYDHLDIIAGQGTMGCEIFEQLPHIDAIIVSVGGGGLIAGVTASLKYLKPEIEIYGVELETSTAFKAAMEAGRPVKTEVTKSLFDGLSVPHVGANAFAIAGPHITELVTVTEDSVVTTMMQLLEKEKIVVEGAGAAGLAAIIEGKLPQLKGKTVVVVLCGANIDLSVLKHVIEKGLKPHSKMMRFEVELPDTPGALTRLTALVGGQGARLIASSTGRGLENNDVFSGKVTCVVETRDSEHAKKFEGVIRDQYPTCHFCHE